MASDARFFRIIEKDAHAEVDRPGCSMPMCSMRCAPWAMAMTSILCDTNFPADSVARQTVLGKLLRIDNVTAARAARAILSVMPLDTFVDHPALRMEIVGKPNDIPPVQAEVQAEIDRAEGKSWPMGSIERFAFYELAKKAYCVIANRRAPLLWLLRLQEGRDPARGRDAWRKTASPFSASSSPISLSVPSRMPAIGETIAGSRFAMGPGGKGSNQSVAAARVGGKVTFISKIGKDAFGDIALATWKKEGIIAKVIQSAEHETGAAFIYVNEKTGENAIIVVPGAASSISVADVDAASDAIRGAKVFVTQLEQPQDAARRGLEIAKQAGTITVFNPAPGRAGR